MKNYKISIPKPCIEDWDKMTQTEKGKHCASCNKVVIDFSKMKDAEIIAVLVQNKGKKICGNFYYSQIEKPIYVGIVKNHYKWPAIAAMLVAGMFQLIPANTFAQIETNTATYNSSISIKSSGETLEEKNTEPSKDSLITYSIKISDKASKKIIIGVTVAIESIGSYTTDKNGMVSFSIEENKIPAQINIELSARGYSYEKMTIQKNKITKAKKIELWMTEREEMMLRGDIDY